MGHDVRIAMPCYGMIEAQHALQLNPIVGEFSVGTGQLWERTAHLNEIRLGEVPVWLIGGHEKFSSTRSSAEVYQDGFEQYVFFSKAILEACKRVNWIPDVVHVNDWHMGLIPVMMRENDAHTWTSVASIFTIHNLAYQGIFGRDVLDYAGLSQDLFVSDKLETFGAFNFLKAGSAYADRVNTVSPTYAGEILTPGFGFNLWGLMKHLKSKGLLSGILNGIDREFFNPATDPFIAAHYDSNHQEGKAQCKEALLREIGMDPISGVPLAGVVSRLSEQKGMDLMLAGMNEMVQLPMQLFVQGVGDPWLAEQFEEAAIKHPSHVRFAQRFDLELGQRAYAGCDLFLMPSDFEPCGLGQMIAMRYGTVPIVRKTGGLADSVADGQTGIVFEDKTPAAYLAALQRAKRVFDDPEAWGGMRNAAFAADFGWERSARDYLELYREAVLARPVLGAPMDQAAEQTSFSVLSDKGYGSIGYGS